ncbi:MAG: hypothetical protein ACYC8S_01380 [Minisyncoccota bacterium]
MTIKQFLTKYWYLTAGVVGVLSGVAVNFSDGISGAVGIFGLFVPGTLFGLFSVTYFYFFVLPRPIHCWLLRLFVWIFVSSVSYSSASFVTMLGTWKGFDAPSKIMIAPMVVGGLVGVAILIIGFRSLIIRLSPYSIITLLFVGGVIPGILVPILAPVHGDYPLLPLYVSWQTAVLLIFAYQIHLSTKQNPPQASLEQQN